jgi:glycosyltransferase involved in cell wall biosynthesis
VPAVSLIIPAYNPGSFLREAIRSIQAQTFRDWELLVVDDNSSEDLSWIDREFPHARLIRQPHGGVSVARNNGIINTVGKYIAFMDQDDLWRPDKLRRQVEALDREPAAAICYCDLDIIGAEGTLESAGIGQVGEPSHSIELDGGAADDGISGASSVLRSLRYFSQRFVVPSTVMLRRSCLATSGLLDPFIPFSGDYDLLIKLGSRHKVIRVPTADVLYRKHANNFSDQYEVGRREVKALSARYVAYGKSTGDRQLAREAPALFARPRRVYAAQAFDCCRRSLRKRQFGPFVRHFSRALWFSPRFVLGSLTCWCASRFSGGSAVEPN